MAEKVFIFKRTSKEKVRKQVSDLVIEDIDFTVQIADNGLDFKLTVDSQDAHAVIEIGHSRTISVKGGVAVLPSGIKVSLIELQDNLNEVFQESGDQRIAAVANELSIITGMVQGPHGEWEERDEN